MGRFVQDSRLGRTQRSKLRGQGECCLHRNAGKRQLKDVGKLSQAAFYKRLQKRTQVRIVVVGATPGRCGSSQLAAHLQKVGANVSHESGIVASADHVAGLDPPGPLTMYAKSDNEKL